MFKPSHVPFPLSEFMSFGCPESLSGFRDLQSEIRNVILSEAWSIPQLIGSLSALIGCGVILLVVS